MKVKLEIEVPDRYALDYDREDEENNKVVDRITNDVENVLEMYRHRGQVTGYEWDFDN